MTDPQFDAIMAKLTEIVTALSSRQSGASGGAPTSGRPPAGCYRFGRRRGEPLIGSPTADLEWYADALRRSLDDPGKAKYRADNEEHLAEVDRALGRGNAPADAPPPSDDDVPF